jgi:cellobiose dehydrogenase (acceptor)
MLGRLLLGALPLVGSVFAQIQELTYTDSNGIPFTGNYDPAPDVHVGFIFPSSTTGTEFVGELIVPISKGWAGISIGGGMTSNPLIMAWVNNNKIVYSTRYAT